MSFQRIADKQSRAEQASLQALVNGFLREIDPGLWLQSEDGPRLQIELRHCKAVLCLEVLYASQTGPHEFGGIRVLDPLSGSQRATSAVQALCLVAQECAARLGRDADRKLPEFLRCVFNSNAEITAFMDHAAKDADLRDFLTAEQSVVFGHWLHPTPKSRDGMSNWQQKTYAPEWQGRFQLTWFAVDAGLFEEDSATTPVDQIVTDLLGQDSAFSLAPNERLLPLHPLQAEALRLDPEVASLLDRGVLRDLGPAGQEFFATSSVRTLYAPNCPWMVKFSIPVRLTNSLRVTKRSELRVGLLMARLLARLNFATDVPCFQILDDPAYANVRIPQRRESGFETIFRQNPFLQGKSNGIVNVAALTADPAVGATSLLATEILRLAQAEGQSRSTIARRWFDAYLDCMLVPLLTLYDRHGIAVEAHQQNALLDLSQGYPGRGFFRDNQGYFVTQEALPRLAALQPELAELDALVFEAEHIHQRFAYYLFVNQIFAVIRRLGRDGIVPETTTLAQLAQRLDDLAPHLTGAGAGFIAYLRSSPQLATKANLLTRFHDMDELQTAALEGMFIDMPNPLCRQTITMREVEDACL
ncbi:N(2)-citryl-N(6)-acetyl-N(6)-hydroxylysine synthase [Tritonibacter multivorans]|uniref:N(2)-citryl-N(6)-acetyl-N(6)-hydroxylysine synthase n=1 Tax=Tritonibacter multivorans TaxID=928856 RepID=A0A0P1G034_9RHOB|nr:IucA/IucC family protein [Tritonibacter multivorans]MDA7422485.1 siderophore biosynthesis protein [Tritonibacter multivorans]CUH74851.1 N(2)-citryl-N(6)-acetyl-N(6)-hydroxylysine synthase [Tritonibacter multivorans]SFD42576.1 Siderophore synthetase component [Tritonibacter multivorans]